MIPVRLQTPVKLPGNVKLTVTHYGYARGHGPSQGAADRQGILQSLASLMRCQFALSPRCSFCSNKLIFHAEKTVLVKPNGQMSHHLQPMLAASPQPTPPHQHTV